MSLIPLDGCHNFRDLGGYPTGHGGLVRTGLLYRSDALHHLSPGDVGRLRDELRIADILDLRSTAELNAEGRGPLADEAMEFHHVPLFDGDPGAGHRQAADIDLAERYFLLAQFAQAPIARVLTILAEASGPAVYHCAAGKDRTGVISAVLLGVLGVADEVIVADYALSAENLDAIVARLMSSEGYQTMLSALPPDTLHADPRTMSVFIARMREQHGSWEAYARAAGVDRSSLDRLRRRLVGGTD